MGRQALRFAFVGGLATLAHMIVGVVLIRLETPPLQANLGAFLVAFQISFTGHHWYTFRVRDRSVASSLTRFVIVAVLGFLSNEGLLAYVTTFWMLHPSLSLLFSTSLAAGQTFLLSRLWVFCSSGKEMTGLSGHATLATVSRNEIGAR